MKFRKPLNLRTQNDFSDQVYCILKNNSDLSFPDFAAHQPDPRALRLRQRRVHRRHSRNLPSGRNGKRWAKGRNPGFP